MQLTCKIFLITICCLLTSNGPAALVWAQDVEANSSVEQTTQVSSGEGGITENPNSQTENPNLASSESLNGEATTIPASNIISCDGAKSVEISENCDCKCASEQKVDGSSAEVTTTAPATSEEQSTIAATQEEIQQSAETTEAPSNSPPQPENLPAFNCQSAGNFAHPNDCHRYYNCYPNAETNNLDVLENICPAGQAFNTEFSACMRDLATCSLEHGGFECLAAGSFADPETPSNTAAYYRCVPRLVGEASAAAFHVYRINCGAGKIFMPALGKCFYDLNAPLNPMEFNGLPDDEQLVKAELKQWKLKEKTKLKAEKLKQKYEKKLQKELAKKASKEAKEKAKKEEKANKGKTNYVDVDDD